MAKFLEANEEQEALVNEEVILCYTSRVMGAIIKELKVSGIDISEGVAKRLSHRDPDDADDDVCRAAQLFSEIFAKGLPVAMVGNPVSKVRKDMLGLSPFAIIGAAGLHGRGDGLIMWLV